MNGTSTGKGNSVLTLLNKTSIGFLLAKCKSLITLPYFSMKMSLQTPLQKHLIVFLDSKLNFSKKLRRIFFEKTNKTIGLLGKLRAFLPRALLITFCKSFITPHLDYGTWYLIKLSIFRFKKKQKLFSIMRLY